MGALSLLLGLLAALIPALLAHECSHDSDRDYLPIIEQQSSEEEDLSDSYASSKSRKLFSEIYLPIRITADYTGLTGLTTVQLAAIQQVASVVNQFYYDTISVKRRQGNLFFPWTEELLVCQEVIVNNADTTVGIASSDLHIYFTYENNASLTRVANGRTCVVQSKTQRPIFARFRVNIAQLSILSNRDFNKYVDIFMHEYMHILGFSSTLYKYWKDSSGNPYDSTMFTTGYFFSQNHNVIRTPNLVSVAQTHFDCSYLQGMPLENEGSLEQIGSHFEQLALHNDLMVGYRSNSVQIYSIFDDALLKDTGWYTTNSGKIMTTIWGSKKGCNFLEEACSSTKNFSEFCPTDLKVSCDAYGQGKSSCLQETPFSGTCRVYQLTVDCADAANNNPSSTSSEINALNSRCFVSSLIQTAQPAKIEDAACFPSTCNGTNTQISIQIGASIEVCASNSQVISVIGYSGTLVCPPDIGLFCSSKTNSCSNCSMNGYCNNGTCSCLSGFVGPNCECRVSDLKKYVSGVYQSGFTAYCSAFLISPLYCATSSMSVCTACNPGYYIQASTYCLPCTTGCATCSSLAVCTTCSTNFFLNASAQCVETCASGYFGNVLTGLCEVCSSAPIYCDTCTALNACTTCKSTYSGTNVYTQRTPASIYVTCTLGSCNNINRYADSQRECQSCNAACGAAGCYGPDATDCNFLTACPALQIRKADLTCTAMSGACSYPLTLSTQISCCPVQEFQVSTTQCSNCPNNLASQQVYTQEGECVSSCSMNYFAVTPADFATKAVIFCVKCHASCDSCTSALSTTCLTCADGYFMYRQMCISDCPVSTYANYIQRKCITCNTACAGCTGDLDTDCIACEIGYESIFGRCTSICGYGKYLTFMNECASCIANCAECETSTICTKCSTGFSWNSATSTCIATCDSGFYSDPTTGDCIACNASCLTCDATGCLTCSSSLIFSYGTCVSACATNQISETITNASGVNQNVCRYCHLSCATCTAGNSKYACSTCNNFYFELNTSPRTCVQYCQSPKYLVNIQATPTPIYECRACPCKSCNLQGECLKCDAGLYLLNNACVTTCPTNGYFADNDNGTCSLCNPACLSCYNDSDTGCKICNTGYELALSGKCVATVTCASMYFFNGLSCEACISNCQVCYASYTCSKCVSGYTYNATTQVCVADVIPTCADGYFYDAGLPKSCVKCADRCHTCSNATSCNVYRAQCHYTCSDCVGTSHTSCTKCGSTRELKDFYSDAQIGQCRCKSDSSDFGEYECKASVAEEVQFAASVVIQVLHSVSTLGLSFVAYNPAFFFIAAEHSQFIGAFSYFRKHNQIGMDDSLKPMRVLNVNYLLKAPFGHSNNGESLRSNRMLISTLYSSITQRSREPSKVEEIHSRQSFLAAAFVILIIHAIIAIIALISRRSVNYSDSLNDAVNITQQTQRSRRVQAFLQLSLPSWVFALTVRELSICIFMQFMDFSSSGDSDGLKITGLIFAIIALIYMIGAVVYETILLPKSAIESLRGTVYFQLLNRFSSWFTDRFFGISAIKKIIEAMFFVFCEGSALVAAILILLIEITYLVGVIVYKPFKAIELNVLTIISETIMSVLAIIMIVLIAADSTSSLQNSCVFAIVAIANASLLLYACYAVIMMCRKSRENHIYNQIFPEEMMMISSQNQAGDLSMLEADFVKGQIAKNQNKQQVKPNQSKLSQQPSVVPLSNAQSAAALRLNQERALSEYENRKKNLSSVHRQKLVGYDGHQKEVESNLEQQQKALLELQSKSAQKIDQNNNYYPDRDNMNSKGMPLFTPTTPATQFNATSSLLPPPTQSIPASNLRSAQQQQQMQSQFQQPSAAAAISQLPSSLQLPPASRNYQQGSQINDPANPSTAVKKKFFKKTLQNEQ